MKTKIVSVVLGLCMIAPAAAMARTIPTLDGVLDCDSGIVTAPNGATSTMPTLLCNGGNGNPENVVNVWGGTNASLPHVKPGTVVTDAAGISGLCPFWFSNYCVDLTNTDYYKNGMRLTAKQLQNLGVPLGGFAYWQTH